MNLVVFGSRTFVDVDFVCLSLDALTKNMHVHELVSGGARGADTAGEIWAKERGIPIKRFPAKWSEHGNRAGMIRNAEMADYADQGACFWDGASRGTKAMIRMMADRDKKVSLFIDKKHSQ